MTLSKSGKTTLWAVIVTFSLISQAAFAAPTSVDNTTLKDVTRETREATKAIENYSAEQRDEAVSRVKKSLDKLDAHIERLEDRFDKQAQHLDRAARQEARVTLKALRKQRNKVAEWYGGLQHSSSEAWQDIKTGFLKNYNILQESFDKAQQEF